LTYNKKYLRFNYIRTAWYVATSYLRVNIA